MRIGPCLKNIIVLELPKEKKKTVVLRSISWPLLGQGANDNLILDLYYLNEGYEISYTKILLFFYIIFAFFKVFTLPLFFIGKKKNTTLKLSQF